MGALDGIKKRAEDLPLQSMEMPEFGEGFIVYWRPITLAERSEFFAEGAVTLDRFAVIVCKKGLTAEGKRLFDPIEDKRTMLRTPGVDQAVIRLATAMCQSAAIEDLEKN